MAEEWLRFAARRNGIVERRQATELPRFDLIRFAKSGAGTVKRDIAEEKHGEAKKAKCWKSNAQHTTAKATIGYEPIRGAMAKCCPELI